MHVPKHKWTNEEIMLLEDIAYSVSKLTEMLNLRPGTIRNKRNELGVKAPRGLRAGQPNLKKMRQEVRMCIGKDCNTTFTINQASKKKFCSHSCQQRTANVAGKGIGSRKIRNPNIKEYVRYARKVHRLSQKIYEENKDIINPNNYPRTLCGIKDGWQLDHILPIKKCFEKGLTENEASSVSNLRLLPWKENLIRQYDNKT